MLSALQLLARCRETSDRLSEFLDGELDEAARHEVAVHLASCAACAQLAADLAVTVHALHMLRSGHGARGRSASEPA